MTLREQSASREGIRERRYKTRAGYERAKKQLAGRLAWTGGGTPDKGFRFSLGVYDLDEWGQPPVFECPCCGRPVDAEGNPVDDD